MAITRRKLLESLKAPGAALFCSAMPFTLKGENHSFPRLSFPLAYASDDDDDGGGGNSGSGSRDSDRDDDDDDDDDNDGGRGRNRGRGGDDDDSGGPGRLERRGNSGSSGESRRLGARYNLTIQYSNGWRESVHNGRYQLLDPKGRKVTNRIAKMEDYRRMRKATGK